MKTAIPGRAESANPESSRKLRDRRWIPGSRVVLAPRNDEDKEPPMHRRTILTSLMAGAGALFAASARAQKPDPDDENVATPPDAGKVVYHLNELDRVGFVLNCIKNHYEGVGGPDHVAIALVVHGPALKAFHADTARPDIERRVAAFKAAGLRLGACGNTMKAQGIAIEDLLPGFLTLEQGGVVRIAQLQGRGWVYLRP
jgi:uncharacterized protein